MGGTKTQLLADSMAIAASTLMCFQVLIIEHLAMNA